jgi:DNA repair protein RadC
MSDVKTNISEFTVGKRITTLPPFKIIDEKTAVEFLRSLFGPEIVAFEKMYCLYLDAGNFVVGYALISQGSRASTLCDESLVALYAVQTLASSVILCHNHPSGTLYASESDKELTKHVQQALKYFRIKVLDHIILTENSFYSMQYNGVM